MKLPSFNITQEGEQNSPSWVVIISATLLCFYCIKDLHKSSRGDKRKKPHHSYNDWYFPDQPYNICQEQ